MPPIPLVDLKAQYADISGTIHTAIMDVLTAQRFVGGHQVEDFERRWAEYVGAPCAIGVANGTDALELALRAHGIGQGDFVVVPAMTFQATAESVLNAGATPIFLDVTVGGHLRLGQLADLLEGWSGGPLPKAVVPVHLYGHAFPTPMLKDLATRYGFVVIEDAAQAHGAVYKHNSLKRVGGLPWTTCTWSFFPGKNLGAYGDAGAVTTHDLEVAEKVRALKDHGRLSKHDYDYPGRNSRLDTLQAAVLNVKLDYLPRWIEARRSCAEYYVKLLEETDLYWLVSYSGEDTYSAWHIYSIFVAERDRLLGYLKGKGIGAGVHYPTVVPLTRAMCGALSAVTYAPLYRMRGRKPPREINARNHPWTTADAIADTQLSLPLYPELTTGQQDQVFEAVFEWGRKGK